MQARALGVNLQYNLKQVWKVACLNWAGSNYPYLQYSFRLAATVSCTVLDY